MAETAVAHHGVWWSGWRRSGEGWGCGGGAGSSASGCQSLPSRGEPRLRHTHAGRWVNVRVECGMCMAG